MFTSAEGYADHLKAELGFHNIPVLMQKGGFFVTPETAYDPAFALTSWKNPQALEFNSVREAAQGLKKLHPLWYLESTFHHRRAELIQEQLKAFKTKPTTFGDKRSLPPIGAWTLLEPQKILASTSVSTRHPNGQLHFNEDPNAPSTAYLKIWEWMQTHRSPTAQEKCIDLGSCPGGWTWALAQLGSQVISVDTAPIDDKVRALANVEFLKKDAFALEPQEIGPVDWLFSDIICYPERLYELVQKWRASGLVKNMVCTIKFQGETDFKMLEKFRQIPGSDAKHMLHNKHEVTWWNLENKGNP